MRNKRQTGAKESDQKDDEGDHALVDGHETKEEN